MTIKKDILEVLWLKNDFWAKKLSRAQGELTLAKSVYAKASEELDAAENTVEYYRSTHERLIAAIDTIEDFINDD